jgi:hypothetical protein
VLKPFEPATIEAFPVSTYVNNTRNVEPLVA